MCSRVLFALVVVLASTSACYTDRTREAVPNGAVCGAGAELVDALVPSGGDPSSANGLARALASLETALAEEGDTSGTGAAVAELRGATPASKDATDDGLVRWYAALDDLDAALAHRCGFSLRVLVASRAQPQTSVDDGAVLVPSADVEDGRLTWAAIRGRLGEADWLDRSYEAIVGAGPDLYVTVYGVESRERARVVCQDVLAALAPEAEAQRVYVAVHGFGRQVLARSADGVCAPG